MLKTELAIRKIRRILSYSTFCVLSIFAVQNIAAQGYKIEVELPMAANQQVHLAYHFLDKIYIKDTCLLDSRGIGVWEGDTIVPQGLYKVYLNKDQHFDFLLGEDQQFRLKNSEFKAHKMQVSGAAETEGFTDYLNFIEGLKKRGTLLNEQLKASSDEKEKDAINEKRNALNEEMYAYWENVNTELSNSFLSRFLMANYVPKLPVNSLPANIQNNDSLLQRAQFDYQRKHYWDYFDYTDERFLYTPFYKPKLETWFNKILYPAYDSVKPYVYSFLDDIKTNKRIFQYTTSYFLNSSINSKIMGMDALFVDLANDYYLSGEAFWANEKSLAKIRENVIFMKDNLIGKIAPKLTLESFDGEFINLHQIESEVTVVLIYEPNCSHCKTFVPEFYTDVFLPNKDKGLQVFAIYSMDNKEEWNEFLTNHNLWEWTNVWDEHHESRFKILYDARNTPGVFVLDQNKNIIAKKLSIEGLKMIIEQNLN